MNNIYLSGVPPKLEKGYAVVYYLDLMKILFLDLVGKWQIHLKIITVIDT